MLLEEILGKNHVEVVCVFAVDLERYFDKLKFSVYEFSCVY